MNNSTLFVAPASVEVQGENTLITFPFEDASGAMPLWVRLLGRPLRSPALGDAALVIGLVVAMSRTQKLLISDPVSPKLFESARDFQEVFAQWYPDHRVVEVEASRDAVTDAANQADSPKRGRAHFFSAGVDSLHSIVNWPTPLDALVHVEGLDVPEITQEVRLESRRRITAAAEVLDLPLWWIESNVGQWVRQSGNWGDRFVGTRMALIAHLLAGDFSEIGIAPSLGMELGPWSSHPLTDAIISVCACWGRRTTAVNALSAAAPGLPFTFVVCWISAPASIRILTGTVS